MDSKSGVPMRHGCRSKAEGLGAHTRAAGAGYLGSRRGVWGGGAKRGNDENRTKKEWGEYVWNKKKHQKKKKKNVSAG